MQLAGAALFIGVFGFLAIAAWAGARASERKAQARYALLSKAAEQPTESAKLVIEFLREDEARRDREKRIRSSRDGMQGGAVMMAVGAGLHALLHYILPNNQSAVSLVGLMLVLVGMVVFGFAYFSKPKA
jgi:ABC-type multidrug transport system fused ATPase/permease subunit